MYMLPADARAYAIDHYEGKSGKARCFWWIEDDHMVHGNSTMFVERLIAKFGLKLSPTTVYVALSRALCDAGFRTVAAHNRSSNTNHGVTIAPPPRILNPARAFDRPVRARTHTAQSTEGRVVKGPLVKGPDGVWREGTKS